MKEFLLSSPRLGTLSHGCCHGSDTSDQDLGHGERPSNTLRAVTLPFSGGDEKVQARGHQKVDMTGQWGGSGCGHLHPFS